MELPIGVDYAPMEADTGAEIPSGHGWYYEPKWDGFRCLAFRDGDEVDLRSKAGKPLGRYFPDVVEAIRSVRAKRFILDGEIVVPVGDSLSFEELQLRLHPAASRVQKLAAAHPAVFVAFDLLAEKTRSLLREPLRKRRQLLEKFGRANFKSNKQVRLSPATTDLKKAQKW